MASLLAGRPDQMGLALTRGRPLVVVVRLLLPTSSVLRPGPAPAGGLLLLLAQKEVTKKRAPRCPRHASRGALRCSEARALRNSPFCSRKKHPRTTELGQCSRRAFGPVPLASCAARRGQRGGRSKTSPRGRFGFSQERCEVFAAGACSDEDAVGWQGGRVSWRWPENGGPHVAEHFGTRPVLVCPRPRRSRARRNCLCLSARLSGDVGHSPLCRRATQSGRAPRVARWRALTELRWRAAPKGRVAQPPGQTSSAGDRAQRGDTAGRAFFGYFL